MVAVAVAEARVLARGGGAADGRALHLLERLVAADVGQAAVAGAPPALGAVRGHVVVAAQHVPRAEVAQDGRAPLRGAAVSPVAVLGGVDHAVGVAGAGRGAARRRIQPLLVPAGRRHDERTSKPQSVEQLFFCEMTAT